MKACCLLFANKDNPQGHSPVVIHNKQLSKTLLMMCSVAMVTGTGWGCQPTCEECVSICDHGPLTNSGQGQVSGLYIISFVLVYSFLSEILLCVKKKQKQKNNSNTKMKKNKNKQTNTGTG